MATKERLISAGVLIRDIDADPYRTESEKSYDKYLVHRQPTIDAVQVVHGKWEDVQETDMYVPDMHFTITKTAETCSQCKVRTGFVGSKPYLLDKICPNCGARMDGGADDGI